MKRLVFAILTLAMTGCGGGGSNNPLHPSGTSGTTSAPQGAQSVTVTIGGAHKTSSGKRHPAYISTSMQSVTVAANGGTPVVQACTASAACSVTLGVPYGSDTFVVNTYDQAPSNGAIPQGASLLSTGTTTANITTTNTSVDVVTGAVVSSSHSAGGLLATDEDVLNGSTNTGTVLFIGVLRDADGNAIPANSALAPIAIDNASNATTTVPATPGAATTLQSATDSVSFKFVAGTCTVATCSPPSTCPQSTCGTLRATVVATNDVLDTLTLMPAPYFVFIGNSSTGTLSIFSPTRQSLTASSLNPSGGISDIAVNASATTVYAANPTTATVSVIDVTHKDAPVVSSTISGFNPNPVGIAIDAANSTLYVGISDPSHVTSGLQSVPLSGGSVSAMLVNAPTYGVISTDPTGACVYAPVYGQWELNGNGDSTGFDVFKTSTSTDLGFTSAQFTAGLVVTPANTHAYVMTTPGNTISIFDVAAGCAVSADAMPTVTQSTAGANAKGFGINRTGTRLYVGAGGGNPNLAIFTINGGGIPTSETDYSINNGSDSGFGLFNMSVASDGLIYVFDNYVGTLHVIDPTGYPGTIIEEPWSPLSGVTGSIVKIAP